MDAARRDSPEVCPLSDTAGLGHAIVRTPSHGTSFGRVSFMAHRSFNRANVCLTWPSDHPDRRFHDRSNACVSTGGLCVAVVRAGDAWGTVPVS